MTLLSTSESSPNCVRSLDAQLEATTLVSKDAKHEGDARISPSVASLKAVPRDKTNNELPIYAIRNLVIRLTVVTGTLSSLFLTTVPSDGTEFFKGNAVVATTMAHLLTALMELSSSLAINLHMACCKKIDLNCRKYPVDLCKGKAGKYTEYSKETGITKTIGQSTVDSTDPETYWLDTFVEHSIPILTERTRQFAVDRDWLRYHTPRNLLLALTGELGELAELFQFKGDCEDQSKLSVDEKDKMGQEISDVTIYLLRLADECGVSLKDELMRVEPTNPVVEPVETDELS